MDNMSKEQRSYTMSRIRSKETKPKKLIRLVLHKLGFRFRKNVKELPGKPDIVLPKYKTVIFIHGCFWHQHPNCHYATMPKTNLNYWDSKLARNKKNDEENSNKLTIEGCIVIPVWECEVRKDISEVIGRIKNIISKK